MFYLTQIVDLTSFTFCVVSGYAAFYLVSMDLSSCVYLSRGKNVSHIIYDLYVILYTIIYHRILFADKPFIDSTVIHPNSTGWRFDCAHGDHGASSKIRNRSRSADIYKLLRLLCFHYASSTLLIQSCCASHDAATV